MAAATPSSTWIAISAEAALAEYALLRPGLDRLAISAHMSPGDQDRISGDLEAFYKGLEVRQLPYAAIVDGCQCLFRTAIRRTI
jgi:hypothetical protein